MLPLVPVRSAIEIGVYAVSSCLPALVSRIRVPPRGRAGGRTHEAPILDAASVAEED